MPLSMQAGLLRVLQEKVVRPVGSAREEAINVRVLAATNRNLSDMVASGTFREDLYYRLNVVEIVVPPLRAREGDVPALIDHFLTLFASRHGRDKRSPNRAALLALAQHDWPGNVRQLENTLLNAWLLSDGPELDIGDFDLLPARRAAAAPPGSPSAAAEPPRQRRTPSTPAATEDGPSDAGAAPTSKAEFERTEKLRILAALEQCQWNRLQAAKQLGMPRRTFYRRLTEYQII
jgi:serine/threonine-protein kinase PknK